MRAAICPNALKQAAEFGLVGKVRMPGFVFQINNVQALGLAASQGVLALMPFYWDQNDASRAFASASRTSIRARSCRTTCRPASTRRPRITSRQSRLSRMAATARRGGENEGNADQRSAVWRRHDPADGRKIHAVHLYETKKPAESKGEWDYFKLISTVPADQAFRPLAGRGCALVKG